MALIEWREVARKPGLVALASPGASLILEAPRGGAIDPNLDDAIAHLAPHVSFGELVTRGDFVERSASVGDDRMTIGRYHRGAITIAYLVTARVAVDIDDIVATYAGDTSSPFDHLVD